MVARVSGPGPSAGAINMSLRPRPKVNSFVEVGERSMVRPIPKLLPGRASVIGIEGRLDPSTNEPYGVVVEFLLLM